MKSTFSFQYKGNLLPLDIPVVMGVINLTQDSFFEGSRAFNPESALAMARKMVLEGASILDLGAQSSRPGATLLTAKEELQQLIPSIQAIKAEFPSIWISVDTFYATVAKKCIEVGADIINDISAGEFDPEMLPLIAQSQIPYIAMHRQGDSQTMQNNPTYNNVVNDLLSYFIQKKKSFDALGIYNWALDLGFGFGKTVEHNYKLMQYMNVFQSLNIPILAGISRKSMIYKPLSINAEEALNGTTALNMIALERGANILRVHDVKEAMECIKIHCLLKNQQ
jgi:dihydropteroate synthase